jgi:hypothetical protein
MAIGAFVLGLLGCAPIFMIAAIVLGIVSLRQIRRRGETGRGFAIAGLSAAGFWLLVYVGITIAALAGGLERNDGGTITQPGTAQLTELRPGDCIDRVVEGVEITSTNAQPCSSPHEAEVVGRFILDDFVSKAETERVADDRCAALLVQYAPTATFADDDALFYLYPTSERAWASDRSVICLVQHVSPRTGSIRD